MAAYRDDTTKYTEAADIKFNPPSPRSADRRTTILKTCHWQIPNNTTFQYLTGIFEHSYISASWDGGKQYRI